MTLTVEQIQQALADAGKPVHRVTIYRYFNELEIGPVGAMQHPRRYPADSAARILGHLGLQIAALTGERAHSHKTNGNGHKGRAVKLPTMRELRAAKAQSRKARAGR